MLLSLLFALSGSFLPLDHDLVAPTEMVQEQDPTLLFEGTASWYDYKLGGKWWSKNHSTCAVRIKERYQTFKVCSDVTGKCIECYHNDYGPQSSDRVIDLSSYAFRSLGVPLSRGLTTVKVFST